MEIDKDIHGLHVDAVKLFQGPKIKLVGINLERLYYRT